MYYIDKVIAFIGPACAFALEPVARLAAFWNIPIITGMGDQVSRVKPNALSHIDTVAFSNVLHVFQIRRESLNRENRLKTNVLYK